MAFDTAGGTAFEIQTYGAGATTTRFATFASASGNPAVLEIRAAATNADAVVSSRGTGSLRLFTNSFTLGTGAEQLRVAHTASAVNFVQVTGAATGGATRISTQGSDANVGMDLVLKGTPFGPGFRVQNQGGAGTCFGVVVSAASVVNYLQVVPSTTGFGPSVRAAGSDTNIPLVLQPQGTGALQAQLNDGTATGGNARGANAVDWQTSRGVAGAVASSTYASIGGGFGNTVTGFAATTSGGFDNNPAGSFSGVFGGRANATSSNAVYSFVGGGRSNTSSGAYNFIGGGFTNSGTANAAVTTQSATMNGTTAVTLSGSNASIRVGQYITGTSIADDTYVAAISGTSLTLSRAASGSTTNNISFFTPHGVVVGGGNNQATGAYSFIGGGGDAGTAANRNVASGEWSTVGGGRNNTASGIASFVGGGGFDGGSSASNTASGVVSVVAGGQSNAATAQGAFVGSGASNFANANFSAIMGGVTGTARSIIGNHVFPACLTPIAAFASQAALLILGVQTTDATATVLRSNISAAGTNNQVILPNNSAYFFRGEVISGRTGGGDAKGWTIEGVIKRGANAASTTLVGTPTVTSNFADAGAAAWTIAVTADTTNGGLAVTFTGQAGTTIRTVAQIRTTEMTF
jgi:hypothetical protein